MIAGTKKLQAQCSWLSRLQFGFFRLTSPNAQDNSITKMLRIYNYIIIYHHYAYTYICICIYLRSAYSIYLPLPHIFSTFSSAVLWIPRMSNRNCFHHLSDVNKNTEKVKITFCSNEVLPRNMHKTNQLCILCGFCLSLSCACGNVLETSHIGISRVFKCVSGWGSQPYAICCPALCR